MCVCVCAFVLGVMFGCARGSCLTSHLCDFSVFLRQTGVQISHSRPLERRSSWRSESLYLSATGDDRQKSWLQTLSQHLTFVSNPQLITASYIFLSFSYLVLLLALHSTFISLHLDHPNKPKDSHISVYWSVMRFCSLKVRCELERGERFWLQISRGDEVYESDDDVQRGDLLCLHADLESDVQTLPGRCETTRCKQGNWSYNWRKERTRERSREECSFVAVETYCRS